MTDRQSSQTHTVSANSYPIASKLGILSMNGISVLKNSSPVSLKDLRTLVNSGQVTEIEFEAKTFIHGPNSNGFRFFDKDLDSFATSFVNTPYLRNHDHSNIDSRDGTIIKSSNNNGDFIQTIKLTTDRGISDFAQGKMDRFSIGWDYDGILCSVCNNDYLAFDKCSHIVGHKYDDQSCEIFFQNPTGIETSAVNVPAVQGTHILSTLNSKINHFAKLEETHMDKDKDDLIDLAQEEDHQTPVLQQQKEEADQGENRLQIAAQALTPFVLNQLLQNPELQAAFASAFYLDDMDARIGNLEGQLQQAHEMNQRLAAHIDALNGQILPGGEMYSYAHDQLAQSRWGGYSGGALASTQPQKEKSPSPPTNVRPIRQGRLQQQAKKRHDSKQTRREVAGEIVSDLWGGNQ